MFGIHFKEAFEGLLKVVSKERTFQVHLIVALIVILAAFYLGFDTSEWLILLLTISLVLTSEVFNTAIETFADSITKNHNNSIKLLKDISAGAVLLSAIMSIIIGVILFYPKVLMFLK